MSGPSSGRRASEADRMTITHTITAIGLTLALAGAAPVDLRAQSAPAVKPPSGAPLAPSGAPSGAVDPPADYVIGADDVIAIMFWREKDLSGEAIVRPDGMISLPLINDIQAAGLTPEQLRVKVMDAASRFVQDPSATVSVKAINSRNVFITGQVARPGPYPLTSAMTVMQLVARAGGLLEFADSKKITILRTEGTQNRTFKFNYKDVSQGKNVAQNISLKPGDTVIVPE